MHAYVCHLLQWYDTAKNVTGIFSGVLLFIGTAFFTWRLQYPY